MSAEFCGNDGFGLGGASSGSGYGLWLSADLSRGTTAPSSTYNSPCLADGGDAQRDFEVMASRMLAWRYRFLTPLIS